MLCYVEVWCDVVGWSVVVWYGRGSGGEEQCGEVTSRGGEWCQVEWSAVARSGVVWCEEEEWSGTRLANSSGIGARDQKVQRDLSQVKETEAS